MRSSIFALAATLLIAGCGDTAATDDMSVGVDLKGSNDLSVAHDLANPQGDGGMAFSTTVTLTKTAEMPVCASAGAGATGSATITVDAANTMIAVTNFTFIGLSAAADSAHIHVGAAGVAGKIALMFGASPTSPVTKTFSAADYPATPPAGIPATFGDFLAAVRAGGTYINVHTALCPNGELRAQIQ